MQMHKTLKNISNLTKQYSILKEKTLKITLTNSKGKSLSKINIGDKYKKLFKILPKEIETNAEMRKCGHDFLELILKKQSYHEKNIDDVATENLLKEKYENYKSGINEGNKNKILEGCFGKKFGKIRIIDEWAEIKIELFCQ